jgi:hypothetical protein
MRWVGFGKEGRGNPNYDNQITGYQDNGKAGYLRVGYGSDDFDMWVSPFHWNWEKDIAFTNKIIDEFVRIVKQKIPKEYQKEYLDFAELGRKLNEQGKKPRV